MDHIEGAGWKSDVPPQAGAQPRDEREQEIERLVGLCEAPAILWPVASPAEASLPAAFPACRQPEPFGMIA